MTVGTLVHRAGNASYQDLVALPDTVIGEILEGELVASPRPRNRHAHTIGTVYAELRGPYNRGMGGPGGWLFLIEPEIRLGRDVLVPDVAGWRWEKAPPDQVPDYFTVAPDWVCEVLSPATVRYDRGAKLRIYRRYAVGHAWLVDPTARTLEIYRLAEEGWVLLDSVGGNDPVAAPPFEAAGFTLDTLWLPDAVGSSE